MWRESLALIKNVWRSKNRKKKLQRQWEEKGESFGSSYQSFGFEVLKLCFLSLSLLLPSFPFSLSSVWFLQHTERKSEKEKEEIRRNVEEVALNVSDFYFFFIFLNTIITSRSSYFTIINFFDPHTFFIYHNYYFTPYQPHFFSIIFFS